MGGGGGGRGARNLGVRFSGLNIFGSLGCMISSVVENAAVGSSCVYDENPAEP